MNDRAPHSFLLPAILVLALSSAIAGCDTPPPAPGPSAEPSPTPEQAPAPKPAAAEPPPATDGPVVVADDGTRFDPPVDTARLPEGAWACDMGGVHYASMAKGDGKCPVCGMGLTQPTAAGGKPAPTGHEGHQGHAH